MVAFSETAAAADPPAPPRAGLVVGNANYPVLPPLPRCAASARAVATALRVAGFAVGEAPDASNAEIGARVAALRAQLHPAAQSASAIQGTPPAGPQGAAVLYVCGYARALGDRSFLLPTDAHIEQPTDLLAQGLLLQSIGEVPAAVRASRSLVLLDLAAAPGEGSLRGLDAVAGTAGPAAGVVTAVTPTSATGSAADAGPTALANAAAAVLSRSRFDPAAAVIAIRDTLGPAAAGVVIGTPTTVAEANGASEPASSPPQTPAAAPTPATGATTRAASADAKPADATPADANPSHGGPADASASHGGPAVPAGSPAPGSPPGASGRATAAGFTGSAAPPPSPPPTPGSVDGRRRIQAALLRIGYYPGPVDGEFGPDTRAAIRRLQHELGDPLSGELTPAEVVQLLARAG
jgi:hypothetical protein